MKNSGSIVFFLTTLMFVLSAFSLNANPDKLTQGESIGFPFVIYTTASADAAASVSLIGILGNLTIFIAIASFFVLIISKLRRFGANRNLRTYP